MRCGYIYEPRAYKCCDSVSCGGADVTERLADRPFLRGTQYSNACGGGGVRSPKHFSSYSYYNIVRMDVWTEILNENVAVVHIECDDHRYKAVLTALAEDVSEHDIDTAHHYAERVATLKSIARDLHDTRMEMKEREEVREQIIDAGYDPEDVPL